jgi:N4-gp56 family major capsid protein
MASTNFAALGPDQKKVWSRDVWHQAREKMFITKFMGTGANSMIQRITSLTKTEKGDEAIVTLVPDLIGDGITGDKVLTGHEASLTAHQEKLKVDMLRNAIKNTGKLNDQMTVVNFRTEVKDNLSYWLSDRMDQMAFLTLAGLDFGQNNDGSTRGSQGAAASESNLSDLEFNYASAATSERHLRVVAGGTLEAGDTAEVVAADKIGYKHIVRLCATAKTRYLRGIRGNGGSEVFHLFLHPMALATLKLDADFISNARHAGVRGESNTLFAGGDSYIVDGLYIHEFRHVPTTLGTATKWGANTDVEGCTGIMCGAQAMGFIDLDTPEWDERDHFDYGNNYGIAYGKIFSMKKMQFKDNKASADRTALQDYGVIRIDTAI